MATSENVERPVPPQETRAGGQTNSQKEEYKGIIVGDVAVGKTALLHFYKEKKFTETKTTICVDCFEFNIPIKDQEVNIKFWDTAGLETASLVLPKQLFRNADTAIIMYDSTRRETFEKVFYWLYHIKEHCPEDIKIFLVAGKADDMKRQSRLDNEDAEALARKEKLEFHYTSAKYGLGVDMLFQSIAEQLVTKSPKEDSDAIVAGENSFSQEAKKRRNKCSCANNNNIKFKLQLRP